MKSFEINGKIREVTGKKDSKKLRGEEMVPCVIYGGETPVHFTAPFSEFRGLVYTPEVFVVNLNIEGKTYQTILQDTQWHPVEEQLMHADFLEISEKKPIKIELPVEITGTAKGIKTGGKLKVNLRKIKVKGLVKNLPDTVVVDVSHLDVGQSIKVSELNIDGVEFLASKSSVIATVSVTRASRAAASASEKSGKK
ncbi:MAG: 50S ribosomal protein L25/general stress protein Ctc [Prolixibacteraceae bacterium]|jgi:large subunit ribosomal protein L25|nr:50S ribosomal protein L25/general stress protein Ctc [Prolixibacteraceae bacterium]NLX27602.1 50S ribosomal protein L25/general stress protein Ctc [Bacteroidales bacterium]HPJ79036.1 50S ribosomal protein L25/general stress protein Ctc [Prolixibacteraceae bacterium]HRV88813.1 50S ribosomal protein L25/general stress protein Ctc [Prolixibacteraceae bacterium]